MTTEPMMAPSMDTARRNSGLRLDCGLASTSEFWNQHSVVVKPSDARKCDQHGFCDQQLAPAGGPDVADAVDDDERERRTGDASGGKCDRCDDREADGKLERTRIVAATVTPPDDLCQHHEATCPHRASGHVHDIDDASQEPVAFAHRVTVKEKGGQDRSNTDRHRKRVALTPPHEVLALWSNTIQGRAGTSGFDGANANGHELMERQHRVRSVGN